MRLTRVYVDATLEPGARVALEGSTAGHITRVLRLRPGDALTLFNGRGGEYAGRIEKSHGGGVIVAVGSRDAVERESPLTLTLAQGVSRGERMDLVVQKATELGVSGLVPVFTERSVVRLDARQAGRKVAHWRAIAVAACEQSGRNRLPEVATPLSLREFTGAARNALGGARLLLSPGAALRLDDIPSPVTDVTVLIGPEGGLTESEEDLARTAGFAPVRLGPRVLRTETAALAALTLLQRRFGDL
jgi:16S rRNA (uracil1498-N3)-methyltransferase